MVICVNPTNEDSGKCVLRTELGAEDFTRDRGISSTSRKTNSTYVPEVEHERQDNSRRRLNSTSRKVVDVEESCRVIQSPREKEDTCKPRFVKFYRDLSKTQDIRYNPSLSILFYSCFNLYVIRDIDIDVLS